MAAEIDSQTCILCLNQLTNPKTLPCLHSFCESCLEPLVLTQEDGTGILGCPTCRFPVQVPMEGIKSLPRASGTFSQLTTNSYKENVMELSNCLKHNTVMKLYCETCSVIVCNVCAIDEHHDHDYYMMSRKYNQLLEQVQSEVEPIQSKLRLISDSVRAIETRQSEIEQRGETLIEEVHSLAERLIKNIKDSETDLVSELRAAVQIKVTLLKEQKRSANMTIDEVRQCEENIEEQLKSKKPHLLFGKKQEMLSKIKSIKEINSSAYEPAELCDIRFKGNGILLYHCKDLGNVASSFVYEQCTPLADGKKVQAGINTRFQLKISYQDGTPVSIPSSLLMCTLTPPKSDSLITYPMEEISTGMYQMNYTPLISGSHKLKIEMGGRNIPTSPFEIVVAPSIGIGGNSVRVIPKLQFPWDVAVSKGEEFIAVTVTGEHCIALFNKEGHRAGTIGSKGKEDGCFTNPRGIAITENNNIIVSDYERIQKLNLSGYCVRSLCGQGSGPLQFADPKGIAIHWATGKILVADSNNHRIQVLNADLTFSHSFGKKGKRDGEFQFPWDVACDNNGNVYVVDNENHAIQKFSLEGMFLLKFGSKGEEAGKLSWPSGITVDKHNMIYITDDNHAISIFKDDGTFVKRIKDERTAVRKGGTSLKHPIGITTDSMGQVYVCDCWNSRLIILSETSKN